MRHRIGVGRQPQGRGQGAQEAGRRGVEVAAVESHAGDAHLAGDVAIFAQQARLAQAARPEEVEDEEGQLGFAQDGAQALAFADAADELLASRLFQTIMKG